MLQLRKTLICFWKNCNICDCIKNLAWARGDVPEVCVNGTWKKTLRRFIHDFRGSAKGEEVAEVNNG